MQIDINDETGKLSLKHKELLVDVLTYAAKKTKINNHVELAITIVDDTMIQQLNAQYRNKDVATDVLSFPMDDPFGTNEYEEQALMIGDIVISIDKVYEQQKSYLHSFERELLFLAVHGFLHLIGYDHETEDKEKVMFKMQEDILQVFHLER